jgi:hypothetical protein
MDLWADGSLTEEETSISYRVTGVATGQTCRDEEIRILGESILLSIGMINSQSPVTTTWQA